MKCWSNTQVNVCGLRCVLYSLSIFFWYYTCVKDWFIAIMSMIISTLWSLISLPSNLTIMSVSFRCIKTLHIFACAPLSSSRLSSRRSSFNVLFTCNISTEASTIYPRNPSDSRECISMFPYKYACELCFSLRSN
jgi:hypothetical protein